MPSVSAACAIHPDIGAVFTCERCGAFGCADCRGDSPSTLCLACVSRGVLEGALTVRSLLRDSFCLLGRNPSGVGVMLAGELGFSLLRLLLFPHALPLVTSGPLRLHVSDAVGAFAVAVFLSWTAPLLLQQPGRSLLTSLGVGLRRFFPLFLMSAFFSLIAGPELFLLILLYLFVCTYLVPALVVLEGAGFLSAIQHSFRLTRGHRWCLLAAIMVPSIAWEGARQLYVSLLPQLGGSPWHGMGLVLTLGLRSWQALVGAFFYSSVLLAWMRLTGRLPARD